MGETVEVPLEACPRCGDPWRRGPPSRSSCGFGVGLLASMSGGGGVASWPAGVVSGGQPRAERDGVRGIPYRKVVELFRVAWGSGLGQADGGLAEPVYPELVEALRDSVAVHADETGWRVGGQGPRRGF